MKSLVTKSFVKRTVFPVLALVWLVLAADAVHAQSPNNLVGCSQFNPPLPAPRPPPTIEASKVPQLDAPQHMIIGRHHGPRSAIASAVASTRPAPPA
jgi:hypothetical protein